jgi:hypothetical protein
MYCGVFYLIRPGIYQHYKGNFYQVIGLSRHSETLEELVVYQSLYGDFCLWVRPLDVFDAIVSIDSEKAPRFKFIRDAFSHASSALPDTPSGA